ncbi:MAG: c-type cytochrome [Bacteroidetes bacterium]|nr:c-type cytochrome [Bacteroidota bacterium]
MKEESKIDIPVGFPSIAFPDGNEYTKARWELGKRLFYDQIMSKQNTISCGSCHHAQNAFSDTVALSIGDNNLVGKSNAPTLTNIAYHPYFTRAGGVPTLEMHILVPIQEHDEFNTNILDIVEKLKQDQSYVAQIKDAYNREPDPYSITRAIANFERSFISGNSLYDQYAFQGKKTLNEVELRGLQLFNSSKANCSQCHSGFNFSNYAFENNGLYPIYADSGRMRLTHLESDRARFKVPTLRNISVTAPYMHDGSFKTLEAVINHYNSGGYSHANKSSFIKPLGLSEQEKNDLVAFLKSLTDYQFINNKNFKNE